MAGLRMGYILTNSVNTPSLEKIKGPPFIVGKIGLSRLASLSKKEFSQMRTFVRQNNKTRKLLQDLLSKKYIKYFKSSANFVTFQVKNSSEFITKLKNKGILANDLSRFKDGEKLLKNHIRLTIPPISKITEIKKVLNS